MRYERANNPELLRKLAAGQRDYARRNPDKVRAITRRADAARKARDPKTFNLHARDRQHRARTKTKSGSVTPEQWRAILAEFVNCCAWCGPRYDGQLQQDHYVPIALSGPHDPTNIVPACAKCNNSRKTKLGIWEWMPTPKAATT